MRREPAAELLNASLPKGFWIEPQGPQADGTVPNEQALAIQTVGQHARHLVCALQLHVPVESDLRIVDNNTEHREDARLERPLVRVQNVYLIQLSPWRCNKVEESRTELKGDGRENTRRRRARREDARPGERAGAEDLGLGNNHERHNAATARAANQRATPSTTRPNPPGAACG